KVFLEQLLYLAVQSGIPGAGPLQIGRPRLRRAHLQGFQKNFTFRHNSMVLTAFLTGEIRGQNATWELQYFQDQPLEFETNTRLVCFNHARAKAQCRSTVRDEFTVRVDANTNQPFTLEATTNLLSPIAWTPLVTTNVPAMPFDYVDFDVKFSNKPQKF